MNIKFIVHCFPGRNLEHGLRKAGLLAFVRELNGNDEESYDSYLKDVSMYARGKINVKTQLGH